MILHIIIVVISGVLLFIAADMLVRSITYIARYLKWLEFVIAFFVMAVAASIPNLFIGISSALHGVPELAFGDVVGNSVVDLTLVAALAVLFGSNLTSESRLVQTSSFFTIIIAILPLLLILDGELGRGDGIALLLVFVMYSVWLFSRRREFDTVLNHVITQPIQSFRLFLGSLAGAAAGIVLLLISAEGVVRSARFFAAEFQIPITMIGILFFGLGSALPEVYFTVASARKGKNFMILGELMGSVIVLATLVLGTVAVLRPIHIEDFSPFQIARFFLIISAMFFLIFARTDRRVTKKEALFLLGIYITFVISEIML